MCSFECSALVQFVRHFDPDLELVTCSGHGKNGALCVLQRELRPQVVTTFELPGCSDMWTVVSDTEEVGWVRSFIHAPSPPPSLSDSWGLPHLLDPEPG